jgi:hypothetical protein
MAHGMTVRPNAIGIEQHTTLNALVRQVSNNVIVCYVFLCEQLCYSEQLLYSHVFVEFVT